MSVDTTDDPIPRLVVDIKETPIRTDGIDEFDDRVPN